MDHAFSPYKLARRSWLISYKQALKKWSLKIHFLATLRLDATLEWLSLHAENPGLNPWLLASWRKVFSGNNFVNSYFICLVCIKTILAFQTKASSLGIDQSNSDHSFGEWKLLLTTASQCSQLNPRIKTFLIRHEGTCTTYIDRLSRYLHIRHLWRKLALHMDSYMIQQKSSHVHDYWTWGRYKKSGQQTNWN